MNRFFLMLVMMTILCTVSDVAGLENGYSRMVYNVSGLQNYSLHWNDRFPPDSNLSIYVEADGINHRRAVGVDFIIIVRDSNNNIVNTEVIEHRYRNYQENDFAIYWKVTDKDWEDGYYTAQIHIYDLLNDSIMERYYDDVTTTLTYETNETDTLPDIPYLNRGFILNNSWLDTTQHRAIMQKFWIDSYADKYPANRFTVDNMTMEKLKVARNENVSIFVDVKNNFYDNGNVSLDVIMDGRNIGNVAISSDAFSSKLAVFNVSSDILGNHSVEIIPTSNNTMGNDLIGNFAVSEQEITTPATSVYKDITIDNLSVRPNQTVVVTVTMVNTGKPGLLSVNLTVNGRPEGEQSAYLNFSEEKDVKFNITRSELGEYRVNVNNSVLSKIFFVTSNGGISSNISSNIKSNVTTEKKDEGMSKLDIMLGLSILTILMVAAKLYIRRRTDIK